MKRQKKPEEKWREGRRRERKRRKIEERIRVGREDIGQSNELRRVSLAKPRLSKSQQVSKSFRKSSGDFWLAVA